MNTKEKRITAEKLYIADFIEKNYNQKPTQKMIDFVYLFCNASEEARQKIESIVCSEQG